MNRRDFLKSLAAIGALTSIAPEALLAATDAQINTEWQAQQLAPLVFYVKSWGSLSTELGGDPPTTRGEVLDIDYPPHDPVNIGEYVRSNDRLLEFVEAWLLDVAEEVKMTMPSSLQSWLGGLDSARLAEITDAIGDWLDEEVSASDYGYTAMIGFSGQAGALQFFQLEPVMSEILHVRIIEGDCPGSSYFAAELMQDIASTNALASAHVLPIRFALGN